ncbi:MAG: LuxR family transcriptional regulator [Roseovarius sp.]
MISAAQLNDFVTAPSIEALWDMHCRQMNDYGFDRLIYGFTRYMTSTSFGDPDDFVLLSNLDEAYLDRFVGDGLYTHAPMVRWATENEGAQSWSVLERRLRDGSLSPVERQVVEFNRSMGVVAGYSISFRPVSPRAKGAIALIARPGMSQPEADAVWAEHGEEILLLNNLAHLRILTLPYTNPGRSLTERQREVLGWVGDGKTTQDIATILKVTPATVEKHLRLAREALGVETTAQAVLKAAFQNQIYVIER